MRALTCLLCLFAAASALAGTLHYVPPELWFHMANHTANPTYRHPLWEEAVEEVAAPCARGQAYMTFVIALKKTTPEGGLPDLVWSLGEGMATMANSYQRNFENHTTEIIPSIKILWLNQVANSAAGAGEDFKRSWEGIDVPGSEVYAISKNNYYQEVLGHCLRDDIARTWNFLFQESLPADDPAKPALKLVPVPD